MKNVAQILLPVFPDYMKDSDHIMDKHKKVGKGFTIVEVTLVIIVVIITASIMFPYFLGSKGRNLKNHCRDKQQMIFYKISECILKYEESEEAMRGLDSKTIPEFLMEKRIVKSRDIFRCPSASSKSEKVGDYTIVFNSSGKFIGVECTVDPSHNNR